MTLSMAGPLTSGCAKQSWNFLSSGIEQMKVGILKMSTSFHIANSANVLSTKLKCGWLWEYYCMARSVIRIIYVMKIAVTVLVFL